MWCIQVWWLTSRRLRTSNRFCFTLLKLCFSLLYEKRKELGDQVSKLRNGLFKIDDTRAKVEAMSIELEDAKLKVSGVTRRKFKKFDTGQVPTLKHVRNYYNSSDRTGFNQGVK